MITSDIEKYRLNLEKTKKIINFAGRIIIVTAISVTAVSVVTC